MAISRLNNRLPMPKTGLEQLNAPLSTLTGNLNLLQGNLQSLAQNKMSTMMQSMNPEQRAVGQQQYEPNMLDVLRGSPHAAFVAPLPQKKYPKRKIDYESYLKQQPQSPLSDEINELKSELKKPGIKSSEQRSLNAQLKDLRSQFGKERAIADKESGYYFEGLSSGKDAADSADRRLNKMENLIRKGNLPPANFYKVVKNIEDVSIPSYAGVGSAIGGGLGFLGGGPIGGAIGGGLGAAVGSLIQPMATMVDYAARKAYPDTEEFEKLSADFIRDAKNVFGNRVTDQDLRAFLSMIPTLSQTDDGKLAIIKNMKIANDISRVKYETAKDLIKSNKGKRPANLQFLVDDITKPDIDRLSAEFVKV